MEEKGVFADVSLSGNMLRVDPGRFGVVLASLILGAQADRVIALFKDKRLVDDKTLRAALEKRGTDLASKLFDKATEKGAQRPSTCSWSARLPRSAAPSAGGAAAVKAFGDALFD